MQWREQVDRFYPTAEEYSEALNILGLLLLSRFRDLGHQEIIDMLNLELMQVNRAGHEIYQIGKFEGKQEGRQEGRQEGERSMKLETAKAMLTEGLSISLIIKVTGLSEPEIEQLQH
ncbi:MAG: Rpn family recombination-promoting nuclease/putative transposase [Thiotrichaceae bacterium]